MEPEKIVNFLFELASLRRLTRSHRQLIHTVSDNISDHSFRVAVIGMNLAVLEGCDVNKVLRMCLFHDLAEARTGDANAINQQYLEIREEQALKDQLENLPIGEEVLGLLKEFEQRATKEAMVAKDADLLDQMVLQQEYFFKDPTNHAVWQNYTEQNLRTESARKLAAQIRQCNPLEWLYHLLETKTGKRLER